MSDVDAIVAALGMQPHPEGGYYVETFRDIEENGRARSTAIYFLLPSGESSHWHRVDAVEYWLWHAGGPLRLSISDDGVQSRDLILGPNLAAGERPQAVVPEGAWQAATAHRGWTLVSCVVAPGFQFSGFTLASPEWRPGQ